MTTSEPLAHFLPYRPLLRFVLVKQLQTSTRPACSACHNRPCSGRRGSGRGVKLCSADFVLVTAIAVMLSAEIRTASALQQAQPALRHTYADTANDIIVHVVVE